MYQKILVGTDGSETASAAVSRAVEVAAAYGASLTILTAGQGRRGEQIVADAAAAHAGSGVHIATQVVDGDAVSALVGAARAGGHDLLVTGNKGMTGLTRFFSLGSVPNKLTHHLPCSLLIVRTT